MSEEGERERILNCLKLRKWQEQNQRQRMKNMDGDERKTKLEKIFK